MLYKYKILQLFLERIFIKEQCTMSHTLFNHVQCLIVYHILYNETDVVLDFSELLNDTYKCHKNFSLTIELLIH